MNVAQGNVDVIGFDMQGEYRMHSITVNSWRQVLGSRSYYPNAPAFHLEEEIITAFITQHYLSDLSILKVFLKQIIVDGQLPMDKAYWKVY